MKNKTNKDSDYEYKRFSIPSELRRDEALALWQKVIFERCDVEDYLEHYKEEKALSIFYSWIEEDSPVLAEALSNENKSHVEGILLIGNDALHNIKIGNYARPKRGYFKFTDSQRLNGIALQIQSEEEMKRAEAKAAAIAKQQGEQGPTLEDVLNFEDYTGEDEIANYVALTKVVNGTPQNFYVKFCLENGEIKEELTHSRAIPIQTAPSLDFCASKYDSLCKIYTELRKEITSYVAFPTDSIAPDLIALGSVASYFREIYYTYPYFDYISSEPESGKTTAMKVQTFTSFYGTIASSVTEALLFREIDGSHCFYGLDNIERLFASPKNHVNIIDWLLSSYSRDIPCKRLQKVEEDYEVRYYDGYGIKAFTHIKDFPFALRALRSRCVQIIMQTGKPTKFYPSADKFTNIRDKLYKVRLYEFDAVKESYVDLINANILSGRTGDLYLPLLAIAKLVDKKLFRRVLSYATTDEVERKELDGWNRILIDVLIANELFGSQSTNEIRGFYEKALQKSELLESKLHTRTVTSRLKKLGFKREEKTTDNKSWFIIDREELMSKADTYGIIDKNNEGAHTPPKPNLVNLPNFCEDAGKLQEGTTERGEEDKPGTGEIETGTYEDSEELTKLSKLAKRGVRKDRIKCISPVEKATCEQCGKERFLDHVWRDGEHNRLICSVCASELMEVASNE